MKKVFAMLVALIGFASNANAQYTYSISTGQFKSSEGWSASGYSGKKINDDGYDYRNRPQQMQARNMGAIPTGAYYIVGVNSSITSNTIVLSDDPSNDMHGRNGFRIHGDNNNNNASQGCIILNADARAKIARTFNSLSDAILTVNVYE
jgi:hypothetical protein